MESIIEVSVIVDSQKILIIFDFDETLVHSNGSTEDFEILKKLKSVDIELCLATRNDWYFIEENIQK